MAYDSLFNGGEMEGSGAMEVLKFYGAVILVVGSFLFGLKSIRHRLYAEVGYFNIVSIKIAAVLGGILLVAGMLTSYVVFDVLLADFFSSVMYQMDYSTL